MVRIFKETNNERKFTNGIIEPIFLVSNVSMNNIDLITDFLNLLPDKGD